MKVKMISSTNKKYEDRHSNKNGSLVFRDLVCYFLEEGRLNYGFRTSKVEDIKTDDECIVVTTLNSEYVFKYFDINEAIDLIANFKTEKFFE